MCAAPGDERAQQLGRRVRWLDRYRRPIAVVVALLLAPLFLIEIARFLGAGWPGLHVTLLSLVVSIFTWWTVEVALAWLTAVWETEYDRLTRHHGLPRAEVIVRK